MSKEQQVELGRKMQEMYNCKIQMNEDNELYCLYYAPYIGKILKISNINKTLLINRYDKFLIKCKTNGGDQNMNFITYDGLHRLLFKSRKPLVIDFCNIMNIDISAKIYTCIEADTIKCIIEAFNGEETKCQYNIKCYFLDLYFPKYKIIIECDENHHKETVNKEKDKIREHEIKELIEGCIFIRYDPYSKDFSIFKVINQIYKIIVGI